VLIFAIGGGMSIYEGIGHIRHRRELLNGAWNYAVLGVAAVFECATVIVAARDFRHAEGEKKFWRAVRASKDPTVFTVLLDNIAALTGGGSG
jgi:hypothetical protein